MDRQEAFVGEDEIALVLEHMAARHPSDAPVYVRGEPFRRAEHRGVPVLPLDADSGQFFGAEGSGGLRIFIFADKQRPGDGDLIVDVQSAAVLDLAVRLPVDEPGIAVRPEGAVRVDFELRVGRLVDLADLNPREVRNVVGRETVLRVR